jgi:(1->4)-alpha-D-glucan 1-alpha-D-glucosylmutase
MQRPPLATYRLQFNANLGFRDAVGILDYLRDLGISHVYASPAFTSRRGSGHGYDVTDPTRIDPDLGGEEAFEELQRAIEERGMGLLLDIVPNHMAASSENRWWMDVLEHGPDSPFAAYFDINWRPSSRVLENKLLLPYLGRPFGEALDSGEMRIVSEDGRFLLQCEGQVFPISPFSYADILRRSDHDFRDTFDAGSPVAQEWQGIVAAAESIASTAGLGTQAAAERRTKFESLRERLRNLLASSPEIAALLDRALQALNGEVGDPRSFDDLERILSVQHYRLAFWQTSSDSINYRRFFSITDLVGVRVEDQPVFDATHEAIIRAALRPVVTGLRIDHIDGLRDPRGYLHRLRERLAPGGSNGNSAYLVVEKILARNECLPSDWPVEGTTGYDYLNFANRMMVDEHQCGELNAVYSRWIGADISFGDTLYQKKKLVMRALLGVEMRSLGRDLADLASNDRYARELSATDLTEALIEVTGCLGVYRTYIQSLEVPDVTKGLLKEAVECARGHRPGQFTESFDFISDVLLVKALDHVRADQREARLAFVGRWQQFTGSIMAKGFEDTALYVYFPLASLNDVGGDPQCTDIKPLRFHEFIAKRQEGWPYSMNATTTHDTKRSEDTRSRIAVLSEIPQDWASALKEWSAQNERFVGDLDGTRVPDRNDEYFFYQTLIGAWPLSEDGWPNFAERIQEYAIKATREAAVRTRWTKPNEAHESALRKFAAGVLDRTGNAEFCRGFAKFQERTALYGMLNGLGQTLLKIACPGVPDFYQGAELWDLRLVDPDNRGTIDFAKRAVIFGGLRDTPNRGCACHVQELLENWRDGRLKLHLIERALQARRTNPDLFLNGDYLPLEISGKHTDRAIAFARKRDSSWAIAIIPRSVASRNAPVVGTLAGSERRNFWEDTFLSLPDAAPESWTNPFAGKEASTVRLRNRRFSLGDAFAGFPVALLVPTRG